MRNGACILAFLLLWQIISCSSNDKITSPPPEESPQIFPLKTGNTWTFRKISFLNDTLIRDTVIDSFSVMKDSIIRDMRCFYIPDTALPNLWLTNKASGLFMVSAINPFESLFLKYPATVGDQWQNISSDTTIVQLVDASRIITVDSTRYQCYYYRFTKTKYPLYRSDDYYQPGIGRILSESVDINGTNKTRQELISYRLVQM